MVGVGADPSVKFRQPITARIPVILDFLMHPSARRTADLVSRLLGACLVLVCSFAFVIVARLAAQPSLARSAPARQQKAADVPPPQDLKALEQRVEDLKNEAEKLREESTKLQVALDVARHDADDFRWLLTVVVGLGALYSLFQAIYSYLNVQEMKAQAQKTIDGVETLRSNTANDLKAFQKDVRDDAQEDFQKFRAACEIQFPMFLGFERALSQMSTRLADLVKLSPVGDSFYQMLSDLRRQELYYYEKSIGSLQFFEASSPEQLFPIFRGFSRFYLDKYRHDRLNNPATADKNDLARARYYLYRAERLPTGGMDFRVLNERGYMAVRAEAKPDLDEAHSCFEKSAKVKDEQQCAHYNLARIDHVKAALLKTSDPLAAAQLFRSAVNRLRTTRGHSNWEDSPSPRKAASVNYNFACGLAQLAELEQDVNLKNALLRESFEALENSVKQAPEDRTQFENDRGVGGDLHPLMHVAQYRPQLDEFAAAIRKAQP